MKRINLAFVLAAFLLTICSTTMAQTITKVVQSNPVAIPHWVDTMSTHIDANQASFSSVEDARLFIDRFLATSLDAPKDMKPDDKNFYCIIHVLTWKAAPTNPAKPGDDPANQPSKQVVDKQNYYVYHSGKWSDAEFNGKKRIYGVNRVLLLYVHLYKDERASYEARYEFKITRKEIAPVTHLFELASIFASGQVNAAPQSGDPRMVWGGGPVDIAYNPSDIAMTPKITTAEVSYQALDDSQVFDNEGRYWFDFSAGIPIRRISQLNFDSVGNTISAKKVDKQNVYALFNFYFRPVDVKEPSFSLIPYVVSGVAIAKQPLHRILLGAGFGPRFANFYIGALWVKQMQPTTLKEGDVATPSQLSADLHEKYKAQVTFGINVPVRGIADAFKKKE